MNAPALPSSYPKWCRVLAAVAATLIVVTTVGLILLGTLGWDPDASAEPSSYDYYGDASGVDPSEHWLAYSGVNIYFSELYPLLWLARGGRRGRAGRLALFGILAHGIVTYVLLILAASSHEDLGGILWMIAYDSQFAWALYYAAILVGERTASP